VALAHLLLPRDFGLVAFGMAVVLFATLLSDGGLGVALIRRPDPPEREDLQALMALQIGLTIVLATAVAVVALPLGDAGQVTALMMLALLPLSIRAPGMILLERQLAFRPVVAIEVAEVFAYYVWAIVTVALGMGVWGLASASIVKAVVGTGVLVRLAPEGMMWPRYSWRRLRGLLGFGVRYQAVLAVNVVRDQGLNVATAAIAGLSVLGLWTLASRILQAPFLLFESLWRVSYPAMSQLVAAGQNPGPILERSIRLAAAVTGVPMTLLVGSSPALVTVVFGARWSDAADAIAFAALGLQVSGPISAATAGYLFAVGGPGIVLRSTIYSSAAWFAVSLPLLPVLGVAALGLGWLAAALTEAVLLSRATSRRTGTRFLGAVGYPLALAVPAAAAGWAASTALGDSAGSAAVGGGLALLLYLLAMRLLHKKLVEETIKVTREALGGALRRPVEEPVAPTT
jgi:O-antigen/teichoic acid export membrane protein